MARDGFACGPTRTVPKRLGVFLVISFVLRAAAHDAASSRVALGSGPHAEPCLGAVAELLSRTVVTGHTGGPSAKGSSAETSLTAVSVPVPSVSFV